MAQGPRHAHAHNAVIEKAGIDSAYAVCPWDVRAPFGKGRVKVHATFDGVPYAGSLARTGTPMHMWGVRKERRRAIGKRPGNPSPSP